MGCANSKSAGKSVIDKAKDKVHETVLAKKSANLLLNADAIRAKEGLRGLEGPLDDALKAYAAWSNSTKGVLQLPSLAIWSSEGTFVGGAADAAAVQQLSAHQYELAMLESSCRKEEAAACVGKLELAQGSITAGLKACNAYITAEIASDKKRQLLEAAEAKVAKAKEALDGAADEAKAKQASIAADSVRDKAAAAHTSALNDVARELETAMREAPERRAAAEAAVAAGFTALRSGYERYAVGAEAMLARPDDFAASFAQYKPRAAVTDVGEGVEAAEAAVAAGLKALHSGYEKHVHGAKEGEREVRVKALRDGATSAAARTAAALKALKQWQKGALGNMLGPRTTASQSEASLLKSLAAALEDAEVRAVLEGAVLETKESAEVDFGAGACAAFATAVAAFKAALDDASSRATAWLGESKQADELRRKLDAKDEAARAEAAKAEADEAAGKPPTKLKKAEASAVERKTLELADEKVAAGFEALMETGAALRSEAGAASVDALLVGPLRELLKAMTGLAVSRPRAGLFEPPEGYTVTSGPANGGEAAGEDELEADAAEAEAMIEAEELRHKTVQRAKSLRDGVREGSRRSLNRAPTTTIKVGDVPAAVDDMEIEVEIDAEAEMAALAAAPAEAAADEGLLQQGIRRLSRGLSSLGEMITGAPAAEAPAPAA